MGMIALDLELLAQLAIHYLHDLTCMIDHSVHCGTCLLVLRAARARHHHRTGLRLQFGCAFFPDVRLITKHHQILMPSQQLIARRDISHMRWCQLKIQNHAVQGNQQVQFVAEDRLALGRHPSKRCPGCSPVRSRGGHRMKRHDGHGEAINGTLPILGNVKQLQNDLPHHIEAQLQIPPATIGATLRRQGWEQVPVGLPLAQGFGFDVPAHALAHQEQSHQLTVATSWGGSGSRKAG